MDINDIKKRLPQRYPFLLVDRVVEMDLGKRILAYKNITANEEVFNGHFPNTPIWSSFSEVFKTPFLEMRPYDGL